MAVDASSVDGLEMRFFQILQRNDAALEHLMLLVDRMIETSHSKLQAEQKEASRKRRNATAHARARARRAHARAAL